jgi:hypothetical protein
VSEIKGGERRFGCDCSRGQGQHFGGFERNDG